MLIVKLEIGTSNETFCIFESVNSRKQFQKRLLHQSIILTHHGMSFTWPCLTIDKHAGIVSINNIIEKSTSYMMEDIHLGWGRIEYFIESKLMFFQLDLIITKRDDALVLTVGSNPNKNLDGILACICIHCSKISYWDLREEQSERFFIF